MQNIILALTSHPWIAYGVFGILSPVFGVLALKAGADFFSVYFFWRLPAKAAIPAALCWTCSGMAFAFLVLGLYQWSSIAAFAVTTFMGGSVVANLYFFRRVVGVSFLSWVSEASKK